VAFQVPKAGAHSPPLTIRTFGDQTLPAAEPRGISKVDDSVRELARNMLRACTAPMGHRPGPLPGGVHKQLLGDRSRSGKPSHAAVWVLINPEIRLVERLA